MLPSSEAQTGPGSMPETEHKGGPAAEPIARPANLLIQGHGVLLPGFPLLRIDRVVGGQVAPLFVGCQGTP